MLEKACCSFHLKDVIWVLLQLGVMTYGDVTKQSPETQAIIEQEIRVLLNVSVPAAFADGLFI